jgi:Fe-S-cluster-containing dehydrogenase component
MDRRTWLKWVGAAGVTSVAGNTSALAGGNETESEDSNGILMDITACIGCRTCERSCAYVHDRPEPEDIDTEVVDLPVRQTTPSQWTVVNAYETSGGPLTIKRQCMHCVTPACAAACLTKALVKTKEGPVIWRGDKCMGCRYCMLSCPFDMPKFEYDSPNPQIQKCRMCWERLQEDEIPACCDFCGGEALTFGKRSELLDLAHKRIAENPDKYVHHIYGEHEAGGTAFMYLSPVPFNEVGLPTGLGEKPFPDYTRNFLGSVPIILTLWPAFLIGLHWSTERPEGDGRA